MTTNDDFLAAICAAPSDVTLRLVYADYLEEQSPGPPFGRERARLIRIDHELDRLRASGHAELGFPSKRARADAIGRLLSEKEALIAVWVATTSHTDNPFLRAFASLDHLRRAAWWRYGYVTTLTCHAADLYQSASGAEYRWRRETLLDVVRHTPLCDLRLPGDPLNYEDGRWVVRQSRSSIYALSPPLFAELRDGETVRDRRGACRAYPSRAAAEADVALAPIRLVRKLTGLPDADLTGMRPPLTESRRAQRRDDT